MQKRRIKTLRLTAACLVMIPAHAKPAQFPNCRVLCAPPFVITGRCSRAGLVKERKHANLRLDPAAPVEEPGLPAVRVGAQAGSAAVAQRRLAAGNDASRVQLAACVHSDGIVNEYSET